MTTLPALNISALAREQGVSRTTIRRRLAAGWQPDCHAGMTVEIMPPSTKSTPWTAGVLVITALGIGVIAIGVNAQAGFYLGSTPMARATFAGMAVAADVLAFVLPAAAVALWHRHRPVMATLAWTTWAAVAALAVLATLGFVERHVGDSAAQRGAIVSTADQHRAAIEAAQLAVSTATRQREAECKRRGPLCREREADERAALSALRSALAVPAVAAVGVADPQVAGATRLASWAGLRVTGDDVTNLRLALLMLVPNLAGLVLAFGVALLKAVDCCSGAVVRPRAL
jgi:hypothetical protein